MRNAIFIMMFVASFVFLPSAFAKECTTSNDCNMYEHERCMVPAYSNTGACVKPEALKEKKSEPAAEVPPPSSLSTKKFCMTNSDCDSGQLCVKKEGALSGVCK